MRTKEEKLTTTEVEEQEEETAEDDQEHPDDEPEDDLQEARRYKRDITGRNCKVGVYFKFYMIYIYIIYDKYIYIYTYIYIYIIESMSLGWGPTPKLPASFKLFARLGPQSTTFSPALLVRLSHLWQNYRNSKLLRFCGPFSIANHKPSSSCF